MAKTTRLSSKGQVVLPQSVRKARRWRSGTEFIVEERDDGVLLKPRVSARAKSWEALIGCVGYKGPRRSIKDMDRAVEAEARKRR